MSAQSDTLMKASGCLFNFCAHVWLLERPRERGREVAREGGREGGMANIINTPEQSQPDGFPFSYLSALTKTSRGVPRSQYAPNAKENKP